MIRLGLIATLLAGVLCSACSSVRFERGPYAIRDLQVVYSIQEDTTFFSWRLRDDADLDLVRFELWEPEAEAFVPIALDDTLFPATPYPCADGFLCFQYQLRGNYPAPLEVSPVRSVHRDDGFFAGPDYAAQEARFTFRVDPVAIDNNEAIDPQLDDWFARNDVPLRRDFEWSFVDSPTELVQCPQAGTTTAGDWEVAGDPIELDPAWTADESCIALRPRATRGEMATLYGPLRPSAVTAVDEQVYVPPRVKAPSLYAVVLDLEIPNPQRCQQIKDTLLGTLRTAIEARGESEEVGVYTPLGEEGRPTSGCEQGPRDTYPIDQLLADATAAERRIEPRDARFLLIYINNVEVPPGSAIIGQLTDLVTSLFEETDLTRFVWAIGSNTILNLDFWNYRTGWRPIEDESFTEDIRTFTRAALPFSTMDHSDTKEITIEAPEGIDPAYFKLCQTSPFPWSAVGVTPGNPRFDRRTPSVEWPDDDPPYYTVPIEPQFLVAETEYVQRRVVATVEVCTAFCDGPFRTLSGVDYPSWNRPGAADPMEVCRWTP